MRILLCDDNPIITEQLTKHLTDFFRKNKLSVPEIVTYHDGQTLLEDSKEKDIVFLDVEMPGFNGIYVGKELQQQNPNVIIFIVTSYIEYLDDAMRFHVFRYLTKPIDCERLFRNMKDALIQYSSISGHIAIETKQGVETVPYSDIVMIEASCRKVTVSTTTNRYVSIHNMQYWVEHLPNNLFFQTHRSFIVNMAHVIKFDRSLVYLTNNDMTAYLTKRKYNDFKKAYLIFLESTR